MIRMILSNVVFENPVEDFPHLFDRKLWLLGASRGSEKQIATARANAGHVNQNLLQGWLGSHT
jgi:hypothetical protein